VFAEEFIGSNQASATKTVPVTISSEYRATIRIDSNDDCAPASHAGGRGLSPVAPSLKGESVTHVSGTTCYTYVSGRSLAQNDFAVHFIAKEVLRISLE
jgi:hypothetical protein